MSESAAAKNCVTLAIHEEEGSVVDRDDGSCSGTISLYHIATEDFIIQNTGKHFTLQDDSAVYVRFSVSADGKLKVSVSR